jgi:hypothetical protein
MGAPFILQDGAGIRAALDSTPHAAKNGREVETLPPELCMSAEPITCPYCNAELADPGPSGGRRVTCPRCGEPFTLRPPAGPPSDGFQRPPGIATAPGGVRTATPATGPLPSPPPVRNPRTNRVVAGVILGAMALMAAAGLSFALLTRTDRRDHDTGLPRRAKRSPIPILPGGEGPVGPLAPAKWDGLRYLPPGVSVLLGVRVTELREDPEGRELLDEPIQLGKAEIRLDRIEGWVGVPLSDIDHLILGVHAQDALPPRLTLVARTRSAYDAGRVREALGARPARSADPRALYEFEPKGLALPCVLWCPDPHTLVVGLEDDRPAPDPLPPYRGLDHLPSELRTVLRERLGPVAPVWLAGTSPDWSDVPALALVGQLKNWDFSPLKKVRTFGLGIRFGEDLTVSAAVRCRDGEAASKLQGYFRGGRAASPALETAVEGEWLTVQYRTDRDVLHTALGR